MTAGAEEARAFTGLRSREGRPCGVPSRGAAGGLILCLTLGLLFFTPVAAHADGAFPPGGSNTVEVETTLTIEQGGSLYDVVVRGPMAILRESPSVGESGRCAFQTEVVSMALTGSHPQLGMVTLRSDPELSSLGHIESESASCEFPASGTYRLRPELETGFITQTISTSRVRVPVRVEAQDDIDTLPAFGSQFAGQITATTTFDLAGEEQAEITFGTDFRVIERLAFALEGEGEVSDGSSPSAGVGLTRAGLGLVTNDELLALSFGRDVVDQPGGTRVHFTVGGGSAGLPGSAIAAEAAGAGPEGSVYVSYLDGTNALSRPDLAPGVIQALAGQDPRVVDPDADGTPELPVWFTLAPGSPTLGTLGATPADILVSVDGLLPEVFASGASYGVDAGDVVDAFALYKSAYPGTELRPGSDEPAPPQPGTGNFDYVVFSLTAGSTNVVGGELFSPGDLLGSSFSQRQGEHAAKPPIVYLSAAELGLGDFDELTGLNTPAPVTYVQLDGDGETADGTLCAPVSFPAQSSLVTNTELLQVNLGLRDNDVDPRTAPAMPPLPGERNYYQRWLIENERKEHQHGPYALRGTAGGSGIFELDPWDLTWSGSPGDNCGNGEDHIHGPFGFDFEGGSHADPDIPSCGHGTFVPIFGVVEVAEVDRTAVPDLGRTLSEQVLDIVDDVSEGTSPALFDFAIREIGDADLLGIAPACEGASSPVLASVTNFAPTNLAITHSAAHITTPVDLGGSSLRRRGGGSTFGEASFGALRISRAVSGDHEFALPVPEPAGALAALAALWALGVMRRRV